MDLTLLPDPRHPSGGYAILAGPEVGGLSALSVENDFSNQFLGPDGKWGKLRHAFAVAAVPGDPTALSLGPEIVDHVLTDLLVTLRDGGGTLLCRLVWPDSIVPRRDVNVAPAAEGSSPQVTAATGGSVDRPPPQPAPVSAPRPQLLRPTDTVAEPAAHGSGGMLVRPLRGPSWLIATCLALVVLGGLYAWHRSSTQLDPAPAPIPAPGPAPLPTPAPNPVPPLDAARRCADTFDGRVSTAQDASDNDRVKLAEDAIKQSCGAQAFRAVDGTRWETNEAAAWYQARFYDPNETAPVFRDGHIPDARAAFDYYARWADRSPRQAEALKALCGSDPGVVGDNAQRKRACAR